jgi:uncharacterized protein with NAD-binding domain and iron-sulfur cluster
MAGVAAAWRLSEPGWEDHFEHITIYQRGGRLGGKGASHRGEHLRVEEHGLHIWLGYYDNSFRLLRECYDELDRARTDPACPIATIEQALEPANRVGLEDFDGEQWHHWLGDFAANDLRPGDDAASAGSFSGQDLVRRALRLLGDFYRSAPRQSPAPTVSMTASAEPPTVAGPVGTQVGTTAVSAAIEALGLATTALAGISDRTALSGVEPVVVLVDAALRQIRDSLLRSLDGDRAATRMWHLVSVVLAQVRGIVAEGLLDDPAGFARLNDEDYRDWIVRHGADPVAADSSLITGLYDLVFGFAAADPDRPGFGAGLGVFLSGKTFFDYKGSIFWKMQAGMGDVVFAPFHEALRARGVRIEYFHRLDSVHLDESRLHVERIALGRQVSLAPGRDQYDPLVSVKGLPCFPERLDAAQLVGADGIDGHDLESFWCEWPDAESVELRRGVDFDEVVFAIPPPMARHVCGELMADRADWQMMVDGLGTVATQALQLWIRDDEPSLGWDTPGSTMSGYVEPFDTWASMPQLAAAEDWPVDDSPATIAYFCGTLATPDPVDADDPTQPAKAHAAVRANAERFIVEHLAHLLPGSHGPEGFRWELLCGGGSAEGPARLDSQFWRANIDPSDRYVQSLPGTDRLRLRADRSGYANLFLAGDWTDNGLNAGCIEGAVLSGLQAANAVIGRPLRHRTLGVYLPLS